MGQGVRIWRINEQRLGRTRVTVVLAERERKLNSRARPYYGGTAAAGFGSSITSSEAGAGNAHNEHLVVQKARKC